MCEAAGYKKYHGFLAVLICIAGLVGNKFSILIWLKRRQKSPINIVLLCLSIADFLTVFFYFLYVVYLHLATIPLPCGQHTKSGIQLVLVCFHLYIVSTTWSSWCTISLAIFRYISVCKPPKAKTYCTKRRVVSTMVVVFILVQLSAIPFYFYYRIAKVPIGNSSNVDGYWLYHTNFALDNYDSYQVVILWLYGVTMKLVPCFVLVILSGLMIRTLWQTKKSRSTSFSLSGSKGSKWYSRTTIMLITIVLVYVCTALPIAIAAFIGGLEITAHSIHFFYFLTDFWLGNFYNLFPITNASVNFSIYLGMSRQFRRDFLGFFVKKEIDEHTQSSKENSTDCRLDSKEHTFKNN